MSNLLLNLFISKIIDPLLCGFFYVLWSFSVQPYKKYTKVKTNVSKDQPKSEIILTLIRSKFLKYFLCYQI